MKILKALFLLIIFAFPVFAQLEGNPENWCRNGAFPRESSEYKLATIDAGRGGRVYFYGDTKDNCPNGKNCRTKSYLVANDEIIVSRTYGGWACGWYQPAKGAETVGWLALDKIEFKETNSKIAAGDWIGQWKFYDNVIKIHKSKTAGFFDVTGDAVWRGIGDNVHVGELDSRSKPDGGELKIGAGDDGEFDCRVTIRLLGKYLIVSDNLNCGGANVTFSGVYRRR